MRRTVTQTLQFVTLSAALALGETAAWAQSSPDGERSAPPKVGDQAPDFELLALGGEKVRLSTIAKQGQVAVVVLRGYPGYQCPVCSRQVRQFAEREKQFEAAGAEVLMIYPGPAHELQKRAAEFVQGRDLPNNFRLLLDPDYEFTNAWHLRWNAPRETAFPSTFVLDHDRKIRFAQISRSHGGRAAVDDVLAALRGK
jgi:thioredoxin-dependent peroxiredoxin